MEAQENGNKEIKKLEKYFKSIVECREMHLI